MAEVARAVLDSPGVWPSSYGLIVSRMVCARSSRMDLWAMYRSDEEVRGIEDPPAEWFPLWSYPPKTKSAPRVRAEYSQDEYQVPEDRLSKSNR